ncbi:unnamed protein product [Brassica rapa]|uniref:HTH myb-type domain-containing protein n=2 Tax=Brassica TaxID=3705 RepID=A0A3P6A921_BRACM|nr:unnamed protein product [Brassica napus]CAG7882338.1 unnamed protein product [Brassica rapa]VDC81620.1 unnamed protein product [Brassica rapa]
MREDDSNWFAGWEKELPSQLQLPSSQANSRVVWSQQLHERFLDAVEHLGINHAVPKRIMEFMDVDGLTRVEVASHLQKYRLYLQKMHEDDLMHAGVGSIS